MLNKNTLDRIAILSAASNDAGFDRNFTFHKMVEEMGEISKAINQPDRCNETPDQEVIDMLINCIDYLMKGDMSQQSVDEYMNKKIDKWEAQIIKRRKDIIYRAFNA